MLTPEGQTSGKGGKPFSALDMRRALKDRLAPYKIPHEMKVIEGQIPRNAMGKGEFISEQLYKIFILLTTHLDTRI